MNKLVYTLLFLFLSIALHGQTLDKQFDSLKSHSETFKQYKVIEQTKLNKFWTIVSDSINLIKSEKTASVEESLEKSSEIESLNTTLEEKNGRIEELELQTSTIEVFGSDISKSTFIFFSFFTAGSLVIILLFLLYQFKDNSRTARLKVKEYERLHEDFEEYKRKALEKQMKLRRDLQTERNKIDEARNM